MVIFARQALQMYKFAIFNSLGKAIIKLHNIDILNIQVFFWTASYTYLCKRFHGYSNEGNRHPCDLPKLFEKRSLNAESKCYLYWLNKPM